MQSVRSQPRLIAIAIAAAVLVLAACGRDVREDAPFMGESFDSDETYSRTYELPPAQVCSAARLALLGQGYAVAKSSDDAVEATKNFQPEDDVHTQLSVRVSCVSRGNDRSLLFVSALLDRYVLRKSSNSASVGVGGIGSLSLPVGSREDSLVRTASSTVQDTGFYRRFFERVGFYVPAPGSRDRKPSADEMRREDPPPADLEHGPGTATDALPRS
ncbi:DUF2242 domain-containing protein [Luteimonas sp. XNQY3]|nr:DUF2242 domain-containing protein [Luteimonas sp. XNQY3]MCD9006531.1 DUF2242 domain-containing protein [Luteimonas sp. XNQY3]